MTADLPHNPVNADPLIFKRRAEETDGEFVRFEVTVQPLLGKSRTGSKPSEQRWLVGNPDEHLHPLQEESIEVISGKYLVGIEGTEHTLTKGDKISIPINTPHRHWNSTDRPIRVAHEHRPARMSEEIIETFYVLAQAGKTNEGGMPNPLQLAVINHAYPEYAYLTTLPITIQKAFITLLAPLGRLAGYKPKYTRDDLVDLQTA